MDRLSKAPPEVFAVLAVAAARYSDWAAYWLLSGAPLLTYVLLLGASLAGGEFRAFQFAPLWTLIVFVNGSYVFASTSWLFYYFFIAQCYPMIFIACVFQFDLVARNVRKGMRRFLGILHFVNDKIAFFDLPAMEIDTEVDGLLVVRGLTISLSSLTVIAHGIEVGIKLTDDLELALQTEKVVVRFFRGIEIGDVFGNVKGGAFEMTFGKLADSTYDGDGDALMMTDTPLLRAATERSLGCSYTDLSQTGKPATRPATTASTDSPGRSQIKMKYAMTNGDAPEPKPAQKGIMGLTTISPEDDDDGEAEIKYREMLDWIENTSTIHQSRIKLRRLAATSAGADKDFNPVNPQDVRASICSDMHDQASIPHPPQSSIKVSTLQNLSSPRQRQFMHRLPMLLRLLLNPLSYFHPITIASISVAGSGQWISSLLREKLFKDYSDTDGALRNLERRILHWLADANFALELAAIKASAAVPFLPQYDIQCRLEFDDVMAYRTAPHQIDLRQVVRIGGADATVYVPSYLLPHHEHLLPPAPGRAAERAAQSDLDSADGRPKQLQAQTALEQTRRDEVNARVSAHVRLPACFDQELLDFIAAIVKATKVIEMEKDNNNNNSNSNNSEAAEANQQQQLSSSGSGFKDFTSKINSSVKDGMKKVAVNAVANDRWIAKLVGKVTRKLEQIQGDLGYSGDIPISLKPYRELAEPETKLLP